MKRALIGSSLWIFGVVLLSTSPLRAAGPELVALFPQRAEITAPTGQLARLVLPPEVLAACRGDLSDLRILDDQGRQVAFLVDSGLPPDTAWEVLTTFTPEIIAVVREEAVRENAPNRLQERYSLSRPPEDPPAASWDLVIATPHAAFVRQVVVSRGGTTLAEGSFFRLASSGAARERLRLTLPSLTTDPSDPAAGPLEVLIEGEDGFYLEPTFRLEAVRRVAPTEQAVVPLEELTRETVGGTTRIELARPQGLVPDRLRLATTTPAFHRRVEVWDEGPGATPERLGGEVLFQVPALAPVAELELSLLPPRGDRLRLVIVDGDSPPLEDVRVTAVVRQPALLFTLPTNTAQLLFGGGRAYRPQYDLAGLLPPVRRLAGEAAAVGERVVDPAQWTEARLGAIEANPRFDATPILAFAHHPGSSIDPRPFSHRRDLAVGSSPEGLARVTLSLEDLAVARRDLADVRVLNGDDHQWAYLVGGGAQTATRRLSAGPPEVEDGTSRYPLELPAAPAILSRLVLETEAPFFDRDYTLVGFSDGDERVLSQGRLVRRAGDPRPLVVECTARPVERLELRIQDGDDAPLAFSRVTGHFPVPTLYFAAPPGRYQLLLGYPEASAPRYELERVRDLILAVVSTEVEAGFLEDNPAFSLRARLAGDQGKQQLLLWVVLGLAVVVLMGLTLRLAR
jgi:hypothetical protein